MLNLVFIKMGKKYPKPMAEQRIFQILNLITSFSIFSVSEGVRIGITHWNDVSGQIESFERGNLDSRTPSPCPNRAEAVFQCIGGLRSLAHWLNDSTVYGDEILPENILRLSSGNLIGGESGWISSINGDWEKYGELVRNHFRPHVTTLGMKEFGAGLDRSMDYIHNLGVGVVTLANTCYQNQSSQYGKEEQEFCENYNIHQKIRILTILDTLKYVQFKIGVIGFVNPLVERLSLPGKLKFTPIIPTIKDVVDQHKNEISVFIAIGDGSMSIAKEILDKVPQVKLVIYGSAFGNETKSTLDNQVTSVDYPIAYKQGYIATAGRYGSSIGNLVFEVDTDARTMSLVPGRSKLIETRRPEIWNAAAQAAQTDYTKLEAQIRRMNENIVGQSRVHLQGGSVCWRQECNLGNLVADAMVHCALQLPSRPFEFHVHSIWHARAFFEGEVKAGTKISRFDIRKWLPHHNRAHLVSVKGRNLRKMFQASAAALESAKANVRDWGQFLQVSNGLEVYYYLNSAPTAHIRMTHDVNGVPQLNDMLDNSDYYLVVPTFLYEGRGVYEFAGKPGFWKDVIFDNVTNANFAFDDDCVEGYIRALGQVSVGFEERIWVDGDPNERASCYATGYTAVTVTVTIVAFTVFQAVLYAGYSYVIPLIRRRFSGELMVEYPPNQL